MRMNNTLMLAVELPRILTFREWVTTFTTDTETVSEAQAAMFIRLVCSIESRRELETNDEAVHRFHSILRRTYIAWRDARHRTK